MEPAGLRTTSACFRNIRLSLYNSWTREQWTKYAKFCDNSIQGNFGENGIFVKEYDIGVFSHHRGYALLVKSFFDLIEPHKLGLHTRDEEPYSQTKRRWSKLGWSDTYRNGCEHWSTYILIFIFSTLPAARLESLNTPVHADILPPEKEDHTLEESVRLRRFAAQIAFFKAFLFAMPIILR